ncbi:hypothetical protein SAMN05216257_105235 [Meinhardsimonia xiamenensis]|uniref:Uncharacterized protein n=1 Tax=Meinhardsimonia xiamenensis TaxID=990712 RepID=A0A1G9FKG9_9RHOB|nr:hypothetical protein [Meinhardsimonia xiamenensis]PRX37800.1 hypothetical protein LV81_00068 [Meinhardsimonia xiamenensis]SDK88861.1 hypothetical protein SAMN05216257_105235 [Meinhardsimonia xiamenensis]
MAKLPKIATLWIGGRLSWLEQLCLVSFAHAGHEVTLYSYAPIENVPEGVRNLPADEIFPAEPMYRHRRTGSPAIHADLFRLHMLRKTDNVWVDADMFCWRPFDYDDPHIFGWEKPGLVCNAVLGLPRDSEALAAMLDFFTDEYAIAPWLKPWQQEELRAEAAAGRPVHITEQNWGFTGPAAVTWFLEQSGEIAHAQPQSAFYAIPFKERNHLILSRHRPEERFDAHTRGIHFWARRMKPRLEEKEGGVPRRGSLMHRLIREHGIRPEEAPIPPRVKPRHGRADDPGFREMIGRAALEGEMSIDAISRRYLVDKAFIKACRAEVAAGEDTAAEG